MADTKTVSDLPLDVSIRWAKDQKLLEETQPIIRESGFVPQHAQTEVILPATQTYLNTLLGVSSNCLTWALIYMPKGFNLQKRRIFTSKLVSFLESEEKQDSLMLRINEVKGDQEEQEAWEREKRLLLQLLKILQTLNKDLIDIVSRCKQFQKG